MNKTYRFKFCEIPLGLRFVLRYPGHAVDAGNDLPESISSEAVETFLPRSAWREGCYFFRRIPIEGEADLQAYGESVIRFVYFAKQWHYDFPYYWPEDWVTHIDQGCKYWNSVKFLGSSAVASNVWREYEYWREYRDLADVRRSVKPAKRRILIKNAK